MSTNVVEIPAMSIGDHSSSLYGGFTASWKAEEASLTEANPTVRQMQINANKLTGLVKFSNELISDTPNGDEKLIDICGKGLGWYRDDAFLNGTGVGQPLGILNSNCKITVSKEAGQASATIMLENLAKMLSRLHPGGYKNAVWLCHTSTIPQLLTLSLAVGTGGSAHPVLNESSGEYKIFGIKCVFTEKVSTLGTEGDIMLVDLSQYVVGLREELRIDLSQHVYFTSDMGAMRLIVRLDGQFLWDKALTTKDGSTTVSPCITLQTRS